MKRKCPKCGNNDMRVWALVNWNGMFLQCKFSKRSEVYRCRRKKRKELVNNVYMNMRVKHGILGAYRI